MKLRTREHSSTFRSTQDYWTRHEAGKQYDREFQGLLGQYVHRSEVEPVLDAIGRKKNLKILDVGCGTGRYLVELDVENQLVGLDLSVPMLDEAKTRSRNSSFIGGSSIALPFSDNAFDIVFSVRVIQHIQDQTRMIQELTRVCRPGGTVILLSYNSWSLLNLYKQIRMSWVGRVLNFPFGALLGRRSFFGPWGFAYDNYCSIPEIKHLMRNCNVKIACSWGVTSAMPWFLNDFFIGKVLQRGMPNFFRFYLNIFLYLDRTIARLFPFKYFTDKVMVAGIKE